MRSPVIAVLLFSSHFAFADLLPVNEGNFECFIEEYTNYIEDGEIEQKVYWGYAVYNNRHRMFLKGNYDDPTPVQRACEVVDDIIQLAEENSGYLDIDVKESTHRSNCYVEHSGGWAPRPTSRVYYIIKEIESMYFPLDLILNKSRSYTQTLQGPCPDH